MIVMLILTLALAASLPIMTKQRNAGSSALTQLSNDLADLTTTVNGLVTSTTASFSTIGSRLDALEAASGGSCPTGMYKLATAGICVSNSDASSSASWDSARTLCFNAGLRLPTIEELDVMYVYMSGHNFSSAYYWSATVEDNGGAYIAWRQNFSTGGQGSNTKGLTYGVRCVRSL